MELQSLRDYLVQLHGDKSNRPGQHSSPSGYLRWPGTQFVVLGEDDTVVLKPISAPSMREFDEIVAHASRAASEAGLRRSEVAAAIRSVRSG